MGDLAPKFEQPRQRRSAAGEPARGFAPITAVQVPRRAALDRLIGFPKASVIVVQGPAGFGKTNLLRQYCEHRAAAGAATAWVRLDVTAGDPAQFLRRVYEAIIGPRQPPPNAARRAPSIQDLATAVRRLKQETLVVLDNFEAAANPGLESVFGQVVRLVGERLQLCVGTRVLPTRKLSRLVVHNQALLVDEQELRFRSAETAEFFREHPQLSAQQIDQIHRCTDGWPAALQCFRLGLRRGPTRRSMAYAGKGVTPELIDYLVTDVLDGLATDCRNLLLDICLPEVLNAALVEHITGCEDGGARIAEIERAGLFLTHADMGRDWFRFHTLFREFLLGRLKSEIPDGEWRRRHLRIASWFDRNSYPEDAIEHLIEAGESARAAQALDRVVDGLVGQERLRLIARYADQLPPRTMLPHEALTNAAIIAYSFLRNFDKAKRLIEIRGKRLHQGDAGAHAWGVHNYARLFVLAAQDQIEALGPVTEEILGQLTDADGFKYGVGLNARAVWLIAQSEFESARSLLRRARPLHDRDHSLFGRAYQEAIASTALAAEGCTREAARALTAALEHTESEASGSVTAGSVPAAYLAANLYELDRIDEAQGLIDDYAELAEQQAIGDPLATMLVTAARIAWLRGDDAGAADVLERALSLGHHHGLDRLIAVAGAELARHATLQGDLDLAGQRVDELFGDQDVTGADPLLFYATETELRTVTGVRYLIARGRHQEARAILARAIRAARAQRRRRRQFKLQLLLALSLNAEGKAKGARRAAIEALELGAAGEFVRSVLDEGAPAIRLLKTVRAALPELPALVQRDALGLYLDRLLAAAGQPSPTAASTICAEGDALTAADLLETLTARERALLGHVARGLSNKDLGDRLSVSTNTVKWHLKNIFDKLHINNRMQAVTVARRVGMLD